MLDLESKIISINALAAWRASVRRAGLKLVATNGCFDLLHAGHVIYLEAARKLGDALLIGLNGDASVRALKGFGRPINSELDRARVLAALASVDAVCIFPEVTATRFLSLAEPECYVKGGDYRLETLNRDEREAVEKSGGQIVLLPLVAGRSTSALLAKMREETKPPIEN
ncbi:MAG: adenylyltransferase/cytidyltransferase family protein [Candidatus Omnitrophica bacterium]|nr:adenylyltransferase/cytidyltransferase family protein [Candidatus Omnitrophota bacterium]